KNLLQEDYSMFRDILEDAHPSLYWYTPKDSLNYYFNQGYQQIADSMTEPQFRKLLSFVIAKIDCGHTSVRYSKQYAHYIDSARLPQFPLGIKFWDDSAVVYMNINRNDSVLTRGTVLTSIDGVPLTRIRDSLFQYMVTDGYSISHKYQTLSNLGTFGGLYQSVYGAKDQFTIGYIDPLGREQQQLVPLYDIRKDSAYRRYLRSLTPLTKKERKRNGLFNTRNIQVDTVGSTAVMIVTSFSDGNRLKSFFRQSFRLLKEKQVNNLVIDLRNNGGGNVALSTKLTKYLSDHKFKLADSLYATRRLSSYERHIKNSIGALFFMTFVTPKKADGLYHFGYFERHFFRPRKRFHYNGNIYILTGGNSFSASTLFVNALKGQQNVKVVGEETGGGAYGNTAWFIPDATLPNTRVRFRLPRFRMVMNRSYVKNGRGIMPDIEVKPSTDAIRKGYDVKLEYVKKLIDAKKAGF
ncbi:MAG TPA: S41 family peptidase, partial [Chitinophagaceae bacterium]|nr:S41 family peptidase [Chitinophagaceae bacterium]